MYTGPMDNAKGGSDRGWEVEVGGEGASGQGKIWTTIVEQQ